MGCFDHISLLQIAHDLIVNFQLRILPLILVLKILGIRNSKVKMLFFHY